jgi:transcriptional regulator of PTS gene
LVNTSEGIIVDAVNLNWKNLPLTPLLEQRYHLPVSILNDCHAAAIGEKTYGNDFQKDENLILINVHHGIGAGIIIDREIFQGDGGFERNQCILLVHENGGLSLWQARPCLRLSPAPQP